MEMCMTTDDKRKITFGVREWIGVIALFLSALATMTVVLGVAYTVMAKQESLIKQQDKNTSSIDAHAVSIAVIQNSRITPDHLRGMMATHAEQPHDGAVRVAEFDRVLSEIRSDRHEDAARLQKDIDALRSDIRTLIERK